MFLMSLRRMAAPKLFSVTAENQLQLVAPLMRRNQRQVLLRFPYTQGVTEPIKRILNSHNVKVAQKPFQTLGIFLPNLRILLRKNNEPTLFILFRAMTVITSISDRPNVSLVHI